MNDWQTAAVKERLAVIFGETEWDAESVAREIVADLDIMAVRHMAERERALQEAMTATMQYLGDVNRDLSQRVADLERENQRLNVLIAKNDPVVEHVLRT